MDSYWQHQSEAWGWYPFRRKLNGGSALFLRCPDFAEPLHRLKQELYLKVVVNMNLNDVVGLIHRWQAQQGNFRLRKQKNSSRQVYENPNHEVEVNCLVPDVHLPVLIHLVSGRDKWHQMVVGLLDPEQWSVANT